MNLRLPLAAGTLALALILGACSSNEPQTADKPAPTTETATTTQPAATPPVENPATTAASTEPPVEQPAATAAASDNKVESSNENLVHFTALDIEGNTHHSTEWMGKQPVVINFWGTWCPPCRREIPDLVKIYNEYKGKGIEIVSLAVNDTPDKVKDYASQAKMEWVMLMGDNETAQIFGGIRGVPTTIFYDRSGKEVGRFVGGRDYDTFKKAFDMIAGS